MKPDCGVFGASLQSLFSTDTVELPLDKKSSGVIFSISVSLTDSSVLLDEGKECRSETITSNKVLPANRIQWKYK